MFHRTFLDGVTLNCWDIDDLLHGTICERSGVLKIHKAQHRRAFDGVNELFHAQAICHQTRGQRSESPLCARNENVREEEEK